MITIGDTGTIEISEGTTREHEDLKELKTLYADLPLDLLTHFVSKKQKLENAYSTINTQGNIIEELQQKFNKLQAENYELTKTVNEFGECMAKHEMPMDHVTTKNEELIAENLDLKKKIELLHLENLKLRSDNIRLCSETDALSNKMQNLKVDDMEKTTKISVLNDQVHTSNRQILTQNAEIATQCEQITTLQDNIKSQNEKLAKQSKTIALQNEITSEQNEKIITQNEKIRDFDKLSSRWIFKIECIPVIYEGFLLWSTQFKKDCNAVVKDDIKNRSASVFIKVFLGTEPKEGLHFDESKFPAIQNVFDNYIIVLKLGDIEKLEKFCEQVGKINTARADEYHKEPSIIFNEMKKNGKIDDEFLNKVDQYFLNSVDCDEKNKYKTAFDLFKTIIESYATEDSKDSSVSKSSYNVKLDTF
jgi:chromosome segregation ATPase